MNLAMASRAARAASSSWATWASGRSASDFYRKEIDLRHEHLLRARPLRPRLRGGGARLPLRLRALDAQPQHARLPRAASRAGASRRAASSSASCPSTARRRPTRSSRSPSGRRRSRVLIEYADDTRALPEAADAPRIAIRGHRPAPRGRSSTPLSARAPSAPRCWCRRWRSAPTASSCAAWSAATPRPPATSRAPTRWRCSPPTSTPCWPTRRFDLVVIATRHHEHAEQVVRCLEAGKPVFVEKPLALTWDELDRVVRRVARVESPPMVMVGFNRRFSPAMRAIGEALAGRAGPLVDALPPQRRLHPARPLDPGAAGRRAQHRRGLPHVRPASASWRARRSTSIEATAIDPGALPYPRSDNF